MDEQELFALVRKNYGEANTEYLKQQIIAAVSQMTLPSKKETIDGLLDWIVLAGGCGMNEKYRQFVYSALSLLKEQEPRVMTLDEICSSGRPFAVYAENWDGELFQVANIGGKYLDIDGKQCPERVRFWTSRPTDEQRKAVAWNG